jgi:hypothetical protein
MWEETKQKFVVKGGMGKSDVKKRARIAVHKERQEISLVPSSVWTRAARPMWMTNRRAVRTIQQDQVQVAPMYNQVLPLLSTQRLASLYHWLDTSSLPRGMGSNAMEHWDVLKTLDPHFAESHNMRHLSHKMFLTMHGMSFEKHATMWCVFQPDLTRPDVFILHINTGKGNNEHTEKGQSRVLRSWKLNPKKFAATILETEVRKIYYPALVWDYRKRKDVPTLLHKDLFNPPLSRVISQLNENKVDLPQAMENMTLKRSQHDSIRDWFFDEASKRNRDAGLAVGTWLEMMFRRRKVDGYTHFTSTVDVNSIDLFEKYYTDTGTYTINIKLEDWNTMKFTGYKDMYQSMDKLFDPTFDHAHILRLPRDWAWTLPSPKQLRADSPTESVVMSTLQWLQAQWGFSRPKLIGVRLHLPNQVSGSCAYMSLMWMMGIVTCLLHPEDKTALQSWWTTVGAHTLPDLLTWFLQGLTKGDDEVYSPQGLVIPLRSNRLHLCTALPASFMRSLRSYLMQERGARQFMWAWEVVLGLRCTPVHYPTWTQASFTGLLAPSVDCTVVESVIRKAADGDTVMAYMGSPDMYQTKDWGHVLKLAKLVQSIERIWSRHLLDFITFRPKHPVEGFRPSNRVNIPAAWSSQWDVAQIFTKNKRQQTIQQWAHILCRESVASLKLLRRKLRRIGLYVAVNALKAAENDTEYAGLPVRELLEPLTYNEVEQAQPEMVAITKHMVQFANVEDETRAERIEDQLRIVEYTSPLTDPVSFEELTRAEEWRAVQRVFNVNIQDLHGGMYTVTQPQWENDVSLLKEPDRDPPLLHLAEAVHVPLTTRWWHVAFPEHQLSAQSNQRSLGKWSDTWPIPSGFRRHVDVLEATESAALWNIPLGMGLVMDGVAATPMFATTIPPRAASTKTMLADLSPSTVWYNGRRFAWTSRTGGFDPVWACRRTLQAAERMDKSPFIEASLDEDGVAWTVTQHVWWNGAAWRDSDHAFYPSLREERHPIAPSIGEHSSRGGTGKPFPGLLRDRISVPLPEEKDAQTDQQLKVWPAGGFAYHYRDREANGGDGRDPFVYIWPANNVAWLHESMTHVVRPTDESKTWLPFTQQLLSTPVKDWVPLHAIGGHATVGAIDVTQWEVLPESGVEARSWASYLMGSTLLRDSMRRSLHMMHKHQPPAPACFVAKRFVTDAETMWRDSGDSSIWLKEMVQFDGNLNSAPVAWGWTDVHYGPMTLCADTAALFMSFHDAVPHDAIPGVPMYLNGEPVLHPRQPTVVHWSDGSPPTTFPPAENLPVLTWMPLAPVILVTAASPTRVRVTLLPALTMQHGRRQWAIWSTNPHEEAKPMMRNQEVKAINTAAGVGTVRLLANPAWTYVRDMSAEERTRLDCMTRMFGAHPAAADAYTMRKDMMDKYPLNRDSDVDLVPPLLYTAAGGGRFAHRGIDQVFTQQGAATKNAFTRRWKEDKWSGSGGDMHASTIHSDAWNRPFRGAAPFVSWNVDVERVDARFRKALRLFKALAVKAEHPDWFERDLKHHTLREDKKEELLNMHVQYTWALSRDDILTEMDSFLHQCEDAIKDLEADRNRVWGVPITTRFGAAYDSDHPGWMEWLLHSEGWTQIMTVWMMHAWEEGLRNVHAGLLKLRDGATLEQVDVHELLSTVPMSGVAPGQRVRTDALFESWFGASMRVDQMSLLSTMRRTFEDKTNTKRVWQLMMGRGKSAVITPAFLMWLTYVHPKRRMVLVVPESLVFQTARTWSRFDARVPPHTCITSASNLKRVLTNRPQIRDDRVPFVTSMMLTYGTLDRKQEDLDISYIDTCVIDEWDSVMKPSTSVFNVVKPNRNFWDTPTGVYNWMMLYHELYNGSDDDKASTNFEDVFKAWIMEKPVVDSLRWRVNMGPSSKEVSPHAVWLKALEREEEEGMGMWSVLKDDRAQGSEDSRNQLKQEKLEEAVSSLSSAQWVLDGWDEDDAPTINKCDADKITIEWLGKLSKKDVYHIADACRGPRVPVPYMRADMPVDQASFTSPLITSATLMRRYAHPNKADPDQLMSHAMLQTRLKQVHEGSVTYSMCQAALARFKDGVCAGFPWSVLWAIPFSSKARNEWLNVLKTALSQLYSTMHGILSDTTTKLSEKHELLLENWNKWTDLEHAAACASWVQATRTLHPSLAGRKLQYSSFCKTVASTDLLTGLRMDKPGVWYESVGYTGTVAMPNPENMNAMFKAEYPRFKGAHVDVKPYPHCPVIPDQVDVDEVADALIRYSIAGTREGLQDALVPVVSNVDDALRMWHTTTKETLLLDCDSLLIEKDLKDIAGEAWVDSMVWFDGGKAYTNVLRPRRVDPTSSSVTSVAYFDQRHTVGIDIAMQPSSWTALLLCTPNTKLTDAAQAAGRLRRMHHGQKVSLVMVAPGMKDDDVATLTRQTVYDMMLKNDRIAAVRETPRMALEESRAVNAWLNLSVQHQPHNLPLREPIKRYEKKNSMLMPPELAVGSSMEDVHMNLMSYILGEKAETLRIQQRMEADTLVTTFFATLRASSKTFTEITDGSVWSADAIAKSLRYGFDVNEEDRGVSADGVQINMQVDVNQEQQTETEAEVDADVEVEVVKSMNVHEAFQKLKPVAGGWGGMRVAEPPLVSAHAQAAATEMLARLPSREWTHTPTFTMRKGAALITRVSGVMQGHVRAWAYVNDLGQTGEPKYAVSWGGTDWLVLWTAARAAQEAARGACVIHLVTGESVTHPTRSTSARQARRSRKEFGPTPVPVWPWTHMANHLTVGPEELQDSDVWTQAPLPYATIRNWLFKFAVDANIDEVTSPWTPEDVLQTLPSRELVDRNMVVLGMTAQDGFGVDGRYMRDEDRTFCLHVLRYTRIAWAMRSSKPEYQLNSNPRPIQDADAYQPLVIQDLNLEDDADKEAWNLHTSFVASTIVGEDVRDGTNTWSATACLLAAVHDNAEAQHWDEPLQYSIKWGHADESRGGQWWAHVGTRAVATGRTDVRDPDAVRRSTNEDEAWDTEMNTRARGWIARWLQRTPNSAELDAFLRRKAHASTWARMPAKIQQWEERDEPTLRRPGYGPRELTEEDGHTTEEEEEEASETTASTMISFGTAVARNCGRKRIDMHAVPVPVWLQEQAGFAHAWTASDNVSQLMNAVHVRSVMDRARSACPTFTGAPSRTFVTPAGNVALDVAEDEHVEFPWVEWSVWAHDTWYTWVVQHTLKLGMDWEWKFRGDQVFGRFKKNEPYLNHIAMRGRGARFTRSPQELEDFNLWLPHQTLDDHGVWITDPLAGPPLPYQWSVWAHDEARGDWAFIVYSVNMLTTVPITTEILNHHAFDGKMQEVYVRPNSVRHPTLHVHHIIATSSKRQEEWMEVVPNIVRGIGSETGFSNTYEYGSMDVSMKPYLLNGDLLESSGLSFREGQTPVTSDLNEPWMWTPAILNQYVSDLMLVYPDDTYMDMKRHYAVWQHYFRTWQEFTKIFKDYDRKLHKHMHHMVHAGVAVYENLIVHLRECA